MDAVQVASLRQRAEAVIFDCDGVLIDSEIVVCRIVARELSRLGFAITVDEVIDRFAGRPDGEMRAELEREWNQPLPAEYGRNVDEAVREAYARELRVIPGVVDAVDALTVPYCVASSSGSAKLRDGLEVVGLYERFADNVISAAVVPRGKPEPDVFLYAAGWMHVRPTACLVIEDSVPGVLAAVRAGMTVLGFVGGAHCRPSLAARLTAAGATAVLRSMDGLAPFVAQVSAT